jgi:hypothetical protein
MSPPIEWFRAGAGPELSLKNFWESPLMCGRAAAESRPNTSTAPGKIAGQDDPEVGKHDIDEGVHSIFRDERSSRAQHTPCDARHRRGTQSQPMRTSTVPIESWLERKRVRTGSWTEELAAAFLVRSTLKTRRLAAPQRIGEMCHKKQQREHRPNAAAILAKRCER